MKGAREASGAGRPRPLGPCRRLAVRGLLRVLFGPMREGRRLVSLERFAALPLDSSLASRLEEILRAFAAGFEGALIERPQAEDAGPPGPLLAPFYYEGEAAGLAFGDLLRLRSLRATARSFHRWFRGREDPYVFLRYVGFGFACGLRAGRTPERIEAAAETLADRGLRHLAHDGYGFETGFFAERKRSGAWRRLDRLEGDGRLAALNGLGRSLWFTCGGCPLESLFGLGLSNGALSAVAGGIGLAAAFTFPDALGRAYGLADVTAGEVGSAIAKGIRVALYARYYASPEFLEEAIGALEPALRARAQNDLERAIECGRECERDENFVARLHARLLDPAPGLRKA